MTAQELELPKGWVKTNLDSISYIKNGFAFKSSQYVKSGVPLVRISNIQKDQINLKNQTVFLKKNYLDSNQDFVISKGDILMALSGATTGKFGVFNLDEYALLNQRVGLIRIKNNECLIQKLLFYFFGSLQNLILRKAFGMAQPNISTNFLKSIDFLLPPLNEQKRIVSKIEELFSKIDSTKQSLEQTKLQLELYRQSLLKSAFEGKLTEKWREQNKSQFSTGHEILEKIRESTDFKVKKITELNLSGELYELPQEWIWANIFDISTVQTGPFGTQLHKSDYTKSGTPIIEIGDVHPNRNLSDGAAHFISNKKSEELTRFTVQENDILFTRVGTVGRCTIVPKFCNGWLMSTSLIRVRPNELFNSKFLFFYFISPVAKYFTEKTSLGSTRKGTNSKIVGSLPLIILSDEEQEQIVSQIEQGFSLIENTQNIVNSTLQTLQTMKMSVLKQAFEGKLVPQDPNDEPAEKLLEKIKTRT